MKTAIIGCGNANRSDDGVGSYVVNALHHALKDEANVECHDTGTNGMEVMFKARGCDRLIVIDACTPTGRPGALYRVPGEELACLPDPGLNLHGFRWQNALYAGQKIYREHFPRFVDVYLIEALQLQLGLSLSDPVRQTADHLIQQLLTELAAKEGIHA
ncbi:hydrogenase maturation protease [Litorivivens lipolytica]|uniref:Hydrogenase maturation protease n=2 Tax=Litorivivens lipolytica TaxID=1524264 RepID=A0A7W4Z579_9GAMM|nr:hydrogenase maturation protease [Litorivivens lipolytica]